MGLVWPYGLNSLYIFTYSPLFLIAAVGLVIIYRLTLHPLARFPGPVLAASTGLYEAYYQCIKDGGGRYWVEIEKMHQRYGTNTVLLLITLEETSLLNPHLDL